MTPLPFLNLLPNTFRLPPHLQPPADLEPGLRVLAEQVMLKEFREGVVCRGDRLIQRLTQLKPKQGDQACGAVYQIAMEGQIRFKEYDEAYVLAARKGFLLAIEALFTPQISSRAVALSLRCAAAENHPRVIGYLMRTFEFRRRDVLNAFQEAAERDHSEALSALVVDRIFNDLFVQQYRNQFAEILRGAAERGSIAVLELMLECGIVDQQAISDAIIAASTNGDLVVIHTLLSFSGEYSCDLAVIQASLRGYADVVEVLTHVGPMKTHARGTALMACLNGAITARVEARGGFVETAKALLASGAISARDQANAMRVADDLNMPELKERIKAADVVANGGLFSIF